MSALHAALTIPKQTTVALPASYIFVVSPLVITRVAIGFPSGCVDLVGVWFEYLSARLYPSNDDGYFVGNGQIIEFATNTQVIDNPLEIVVKGYNDDDSFNHKIWINLDIDYVVIEQINRITLVADNPNFPHNRSS